MKNQIRIIGLDLDGTLYPSTPEIQKRIRTKIYEKISAEFKIPYEHAKDLFEQHYAQLSSGSRTIKAIAEHFQKPIPEADIIQESLEQADVLDLIEKNPELAAMLSRIAKIKTLDLLTGSAHSLAVRKLERLGIPSQTFARMYADEDGSKSSGELYQKWLADTQLPANQHLYVGDNKKIDIDVPKSLGIQTCFLGQYKNADFQINNILELEKFM